LVSWGIGSTFIIYALQDTGEDNFWSIESANSKY